MHTRKASTGWCSVKPRPRSPTGSAASGGSPVTRLISIIVLLVVGPVEDWTLGAVAQAAYDGEEAGDDWPRLG